MKHFIITVDTEGDNLWSYQKGDNITTLNADYIPRFQELCERYNFKPVYLTNYEMLCNDNYVEYVKAKEQLGLCEVGIHLHAWNNPPLYELNAKYDGNPYLIEYPDNIMKAKFDCLYNLFVEKIGHKPTSHRAGRWAVDERYFKLLEEYDIKVDCSITPGIDWSNNLGETRGGADYNNAPKGIHYVNNVLEIPPTIRKSHYPIDGSIKHRIKSMISGNRLELRPAICSLKQMKYLINRLLKYDKCDYIELMIHSSELMPAGSPYFPNKTAVDNLYNDLESLFKFIKCLNFKGASLADYYNIQTNLAE